MRRFRASLIDAPWLVFAMLASACGGRSDFEDGLETAGNAGVSGVSGGGRGGTAGGGSGFGGAGGGITSGGQGGVGAQGGFAGGATGGFSGKGGFAGKAGTAGQGGFPAGGAPNGGFAGKGGGPSGGGAPSGCFGCIASTCPQFVTCLSNPVCFQGLDCAAQNCITEFGADFQCIVFGCFNGDFETAFLAFDAVTCIQRNCSGLCN